VFVVAICERNGDPEREARELAPVLGVLAYDLRLAMSGLPPRVVLRTPSFERAEEAMAALRARGHGAIACDMREVTGTPHMTNARRFAIDAYAFHADAERGPALPFDAVGAFVRAAFRSRADTALTEREILHDDDGSAHVIEREALRKLRETFVEQALYIVPHDGAPWVLRENEARYVALGDRRRPTTHENFTATVALLREHAPEAAFDDRYVTHPLEASAPVRSLAPDPGAFARRVSENDLTIHLLARWLLRARGGPYRG
jgi:hypothetical protein